MLQYKNDDIINKKVIVSGAGNVATATIEKLLDEQAIPLTVSDISGIVYAKNGITRELYNEIYYLYQNRKLLIDFSDYEKYNATFIKVDITNGDSIWTKLNELDIQADIALTCATQNEINEHSALNLINIGVKLVAEGSNMGCTSEAVSVFNKHDVFYAGGKMANCGGVCVSQFEMQQNASKSQWTAREVDHKLQEVMAHVFEICSDTSSEYNVTLTEGANIISFLTVVDAMEKQGYIW
jgi:glutamate dehydrogenase (NADP+)